MSVKEPYIALGACLLWGLYGAYYFVTASRKRAKPLFVKEKPASMSA
jgi:hypothetical protein